MPGPSSIPHYTDQDAVYQADSCLPLRRAVAEGHAVLHAMVRGQYPGEALRTGQLPGVRTVGYWDLVGPQQWGLPWHRNEGIEFTFLETGSHYFESEHTAVELHPKALTITRPWQSHRLGNPHLQAGRLHWLILDVKVRRPHQAWRWPKWIGLAPVDIDRLTQLLSHNEQPVWTGNEQMLACFQKLSKAVTPPRPSTWLSRLVVHLNEFLLLTLELLESEGAELDAALTSTPRSVAMFLEHLKQSPELLGQPWSVAEMADKCDLGSTQFTAHCKRLVNTTPLKYLNLCRLDCSAKMLHDVPPRPITQIALKLGFSSSQHFANQFHRRFDMTPTAYRRNASAARARANGDAMDR